MTIAHTPTSPLPLGALAAGFGLSLLSASALAQSPAVAPDSTDQTLPTVSVKAKADPKPAAKQSYQATTTQIGKGKQALRDIPQSVTVVTEKLMDDRNIDTLKEALHNTAGITFMAAEGGEEDIRLRGFSLAGAGDIFVDGIRDPAFYERDTFNTDRIELLRGSASMLFGRGSTGGAVNQVSKAPYLGNGTEVSGTIGSHNFVRATGDVNIKTSDTSAVRINVMSTKADNNGAGSSLDKRGIAGAYRFGIGSSDDVTISAYHLENNNGINYGIPWIKPRSTDTQASNTVISSLDPSTYYGMASDRNAGSADFYTLSHVHRFSSDTELKSSIRRGYFTRDQRASAIRFKSGNGIAAADLSNLSDSTRLTRGNNFKVQDLDTLYAQTDLSSKFVALGLKNEAVIGTDFSQEKKRVFSAIGTQAAKADTSVGTPDDGIAMNEDARVLGQGNDFTSRGLGVYAQDLVQLAPEWKILGGLRYDMMKGRYNTYTPATGAQTGQYSQHIHEWSKRTGVLYQPNPLQSFHASYGTSFNTSGDAYSYSALSANTPPESSRNIELGAKIDSADGDVTTRLALFHSTKYHERNTDTTSVSDSNYELSAQRHSAGFETDVTGRFTEQWEVYVSYTFMPIAKVDETSSSATAGNRKGDRTGLSPKHSGTVWNTYAILPNWRTGLGINFRSKQSPADISQSATNPLQQGIWTAPGYATLDLMSEYTLNKHYALKVNLNNAGNKLYADSLYRGHYIPGAGRNLQVSLTAKF
jgi:catecholate siderophore receptor